MPPQLAEPYGEEVTQACTEVAHPRVCQIASSKEATVRVAAVTSENYRISYWVDGRWLRSRLAFQPQDGGLDRARAVGITVGVLVARNGSPTPVEKPARSERTHGDSRARGAEGKPGGEPIPTGDAFEVELDASGLVAPGVTRPRFGGELAVAGFFAGFPLGFFVHGRWAGAPADADGLSATWMGAGMGPVLRWRPTFAFSVDARAAYFREQLRVAVPEVQGEFVAEQADRSYNTFYLSTGASYRVLGAFGLRLALSLNTTPRQSVSLQGERVGENPTPAFSGLFGVAWEL